MAYLPYTVHGQVTCKFQVQRFWSVALKTVISNKLFLRIVTVLANHLVGAL